ncbi:hypothetical protein RclHR1_08180012 [Rhizophagus clarus]|uniref:Uncharacterized protein n=1 Tax=Rhizophagus clarus TaxID=94130 RepID=A0A2Z6RZJ5_9GLOM|nr:hypothetical protein RclHR1_08180012 [Rhizophagus clarus]
MEPPMSESLDSLTALVSRNHAKANKLQNDLKKCRKLLLKLVTDLSIVSELVTHAQLVTNVATLSRMILDGSFSLAEFCRQILTDELHLSMWTRDPDLSNNLHKVAPADSVTIKPIVKHLPRLKFFLPISPRICLTTLLDEAAAPLILIQKRSRTISEQAMNEDIVAGTAADVGIDGPSSPPKENNTASTSLSSHSNIAVAQQ